MRGTSENFSTFRKMKKNNGVTDGTEQELK